MTPQGTWARNNAEKDHTFAKYLEQVFQFQPLENTPEEKEDLIQLLSIILREGVMWEVPMEGSHITPLRRMMLRR
jgi:hypothetical protein